MRITETVFEGERPGEGWHAHGWTSKGLWVVHDDRLVWLRLHKRRWLRVETGQTCHSRPVWDVPHSPYGLDVVFHVLGAWLLAVRGLHHVAWPWSDQQPERPARRTAQRMLHRVALDAPEQVEILCDLKRQVPARSIERVIQIAEALD